MNRWCVALACGLALFLLGPATPVSAHASFLGSTPADGSVLAESPAVAELRFSEEVLLNASSVTLLQLGSGQTEELKISATKGGTTVVAQLPQLERGAYVMRYAMLDPADLHKTVGSISFGVGVAAPPSVSGEQVVGSWSSVTLRIGADIGLLLVVGAASVTLLLARRDHEDVELVGRLALIAAAVVAMGWIGLLLTDAAVIGFERVQWGSLLIQSDPGRRALVGVQLGLGTWWTVRLLRRSRHRAGRRFVAGILALIAAGFVVTAAYGGHAGIGGSFTVGVALRAAHLAALGLWIGTVAVMWLIGRRDGRLRPLWRQVSSLAAIGLAATGASGLLLSGRVAATVTALLGTSYGQRIVIKAGILVVLGVLGALAARSVANGKAPQRLLGELAAAAVAVVIAALLASSAPARGEQFLPLPADNPQIVTSNVDDLVVSASMEPARPGPNLVVLRIADSRRPAPGPLVGVAMRLTSADGMVVAERDGLPADGMVEWADVAVPAPGSYRVEVDVDRPASPVHTYVASWDVDVAPQPRAERIVSNGSWAPIATAVAAAWVALIAAAWWAIRRRASYSRVTGPHQG